MVEELTAGVNNNGEFCGDSLHSIPIVSTPNHMLTPLRGGR